MSNLYKFYITIWNDSVFYGLKLICGCENFETFTRIVITIHRVHFDKLHQIGKVFYDVIKKIKLMPIVIDSYFSLLQITVTSKKTLSFA